MMIKVLAIGDVGNIITTISKFSKSKIHVINFIQDGMGKYTYADDVKTFSSYKVSEQVKQINQIKDEFDICITMGTGERIAYLADLNYVPFYVGRDIDAPRFKKNSKEEWFDEPLHKLNFFERRFYKNAFENAVSHVAYGWAFEHLKKFTENGIKMDMEPVDPDLFNEYAIPLEREKTKFTFFSPQRMGKPKGTDLLWEAIPHCKTDFDVLQVEWFDESTNEELKIKKKLIETKPEKVKFISRIKRNDMARYYNFSDAVIGNLRIGFHELVTCESVLCKKPIIQYADPKFDVMVNGKKIDVPFLPKSNNPKDIAKTIDMIVGSESFRNQLYDKELEYVKQVSDPKKAAKWWDELFVQLVNRHKTIRKNSPPWKIKLRMWNFLISNRLYWNKLKNIGS